MNTEREPSTSTTRDLRSICHPTHAAVVAWLGLGRLVARTERLLGAALRSHGLNCGQFAVLLTIGAAEGLTQQELADRLSLTKANVSQLLDRLQAAELVRRVPVERAYALHLTDASRELLDTMVPEQEQLIIAQFADLSPEEQVEFRDLIDRLAPGPA